MYVCMYDVDISPPAKKTRHECPTCKKVFTRADNLKQHQQIHINEKQHDCPKCDQKFRRKSHLLRHEKQVHERRAAQREYKCTTCGDVCHNIAPFQAHQKTAHTKPSLSKKRPRDEETGRKQ